MNEEQEPAAAPARTGPDVVAPTNRVNVAFPFSKLTLQEPSGELAELADVIVELARIVEELAPGPGSTSLRARAEVVVQRLR